MNSDISRQTFDAKRHYIKVVMQQGRVQTDADEVGLARATVPLLGDLPAVLPALWLDDEIPLARVFGPAQ